MDMKGSEERAGAAAIATWQPPNIAAEMRAHLDATVTGRAVDSSGRLLAEIVADIQSMLHAHECAGDISSDWRESRNGQPYVTASQRTATQGWRKFAVIDVHLGGKLLWSSGSPL